MELSPIARTLLAARYQKPGETPEQLFLRVARVVDTPRAEEFHSAMTGFRFLPNSPTLMNAGTSLGQLSACFVLPVEDSIQSIFSTLLHMALIHKTGGGTGFSFSRLRPAGDHVDELPGVASGPLSFMRVYDEATNALKQGGRRRGANMGVLSSRHPDIEAFMTSKTGGGLRNFNISVGFDEKFFECREKGSPYDLVNPRTKEVVRTVNPEYLWSLLVEAAWRTGDPGVLFMDRINEKNTVPGLGSMEATNPCGEQPLLPNESCNLGSVNLAACVKKGDIDEELLRSTARLGTQFLDATIDVNRFPIEEIRQANLLTRKIGIGIMGLADAMIRLGIVYATSEGLAFAGKMMATVQEEAHATSEELGERLGSFPAIDKSIYTGPMRNATVTTVAPTGSLHIIAGTSSGIEPLFSLSYTRVIADREVSFIYPLLEELLAGRGGGTDLMAAIRRTGSVQDLPVGDELKELLRTANEIPAEHHIRMQATVQRYVDNAVSKTVNLPEEATVAEVSRCYSLARELGCKGVTIYRYNSKEEQVMVRGCTVCDSDLP